MKIVFKKDYMLLTVFTKCSMNDVWQGWICFGFWFWIYQDFKYIWVLNMQGLKRVLNMPEYTWVNSEHASICLNMPKYAWMCLNLPEWLLFYFPIKTPGPLECVLTYFIVNTKLEVMWRNTRLLSWRDKIWFFL